MARFFKSFLIILLSFFTSIVVLSLVVFGLILALASYVAPDVEAPKRGSVLEIDLSQEISDSPRQMPLFNLRKLSLEDSSPLSLLSVLRALEAAAADPNITALSLRMDGENALPLALAEELRDGVERFKVSSGKPVYSYSQSYSQSSYYLASIADSLYLEPLGSVEWKGVSMAGYYYGSALKELGVGVEVFRPAACRFKSAVEPYILSEQSAESRAQSQRLVDELWSGVVEQVAKSRNKRAEDLDMIANQEIFVDSDSALRSGLIDGVAYYNDYMQILKRCGVMEGEGGGLRRVSLMNYSLIQQQSYEMGAAAGGVLSSSKIGVIYADGVIMDGVSESGSDPIVGSETLTRQLRKARCDESVKAVVLRVNSPGGSALAADAMWREVELLRGVKPVVVSMGSYAASGGYYISAPADIILADRYTLTGSIGVYSLMFNYAETLSRNLKINIDGVVSAPSADFGRVPRALNETEQQVMQRSVDEIYSTFMNKVSEGRNLPQGVVSTLSGGQVWSGIEAAACGLADRVGGLHTALALAVERSALREGEYQVIEIEDDKSGIELLMSMVGVAVQSLLGGEITESMLALNRVQEIAGSVMHYPIKVRF